MRRTCAYAASLVAGRMLHADTVILRPPSLRRLQEAEAQREEAAGELETLRRELEAEKVRVNRSRRCILFEPQRERINWPQY